MAEYRGLPPRAALVQFFDTELTYEAFKRKSDEELAELLMHWLHSEGLEVAVEHVCNECLSGLHHACSEPGTCRCTINPDTGEDEWTGES